LTQSIQSLEISPVMQQVSVLNLRINDMMMQLNVVIKTLLEENSALKQENTQSKTKQESKS
jgi:hypothetical protein